MVDLIPRQHLFGNPTRYGHQISPDGKRLAWVAPLDGVEDGIGAAFLEPLARENIGPHVSL
jgi:hypothetical protein